MSSVKFALILAPTAGMLAAGETRREIVNPAPTPAEDSKSNSETSAPCDLIGMNGYVKNGKLHARITLANPGKAFGGHLEPGSTVFTFAIVTTGGSWKIVWI